MNLDWDHVMAGHLFKIFSSQLSTSSPQGKNGTGPVGGRLLLVRVYPSEFGKKRMAEEDKHGPPAEVFRTSGEYETRTKTIPRSQAMVRNMTKTRSGDIS